MSLVCEMAAPFVANNAVDGDDVARLFRAHASTCLRCQARHAAMSRTARQLAAMSSARLTAPAELEWRVMSSLGDDPNIPDSWRAPVAWAAAAVSMAAAIVVWWLRPKVV